MQIIKDIFQRTIRLTVERWAHIKDAHPEMENELGKVEETLQNPDKVVQSNTDNEVELFYKNYASTLLGEKLMCVVVKVLPNDLFVITAYLTDAIKKGKEIWIRK